MRRPPAVAVMARVPGAAPVKSRLHAALTPARATDLYRCFLLDRLEALAALDVVRPVVAFTPAHARAAMAALVPPPVPLLAQEGEDLSARLTGVFARLFDDGHVAAIALDSDSPTLPMAYVSEAARVLLAEQADVVIGPADDGGYYLIGVRRRQPGLFDGIPWSTSETRAATLARARDLGLGVRLLPPWFDVDTPDDLRRLRAGVAGCDTAPRTAAFLRTLAC
ncbi:MAG TPA: TIGR04282 family arsenosugar biosynthesis glycosyltransferase [Candidatus Binatia bacterium]|nr:TIGR04282 family arsenosugar biosynthesis glycosyltransferase [Candidatus Binatia bacterium]